MFFSSLVMADEWDDCVTTGKSFGRGNYISAAPVSAFQRETDDNGWDDYNDGNTASNNAGNVDAVYDNRNGYRGRGSGRGREGRGRRGREFGGEKGVDDHKKSFDRNKFEVSDNTGSRRNNRGDRGNNNNRDRDRGTNSGKSTEKPREFYIPPEPPENEEEIFSSGISSGINFDKYDKIHVNVTPGAPPAISSFAESGLRPFVLENVQKSGYIVPTPIQKNAIPIIMAERDLMACAQTGSGKTAAFLLPIINDLLLHNDNLFAGKPHALIVSPTRELSIQIYYEARKFSLGSFLKIGIVYGGTAVKHQGNNVSKGCHILVCTPGRLIDFVDKGYISFENCRFVVLDEADRMLDMGFISSIEEIMSNPTMPPIEKRQTLMFSATFPEEIQRLAGQFLNNYIFLAIGIVGGACEDVDQNFHLVTKFEKRTKLTEILQQSEPGGTMVFVEMKRTADFLASLLSETKFPTTSIHGDRLQREREQALGDFKNGRMSVLIATSVAARGLDIKNVMHVINYDLPKSIDEYVHRIGRTGRLGNCGRATSFFDPHDDRDLAPALVKILKQANKPVPDFLLSIGSGDEQNYYSSGRGNKFGGRDVRNHRGNRNVEIDNFGQISSTAEPVPLEPEEEW